MYDELTYEERFIQRLVQLRMNKGVSARDMSLSIGQNPGYINSIESGKSLPSMTTFFYICEYFNMTPANFFDFGCTRSPGELNALYHSIKRLSDSQFKNISEIVSDLAQNNERHASRVTLM